MVQLANMFYKASFLVLPGVIFFLCFSVLWVLRLPRLGKRELILVLFVRLFDLRLFGFVGFLFLTVSRKGCGLWLWHSLDFSLTFFTYGWLLDNRHTAKYKITRNLISEIKHSTKYKIQENLFIARFQTINTPQNILYKYLYLRFALR